MTIDDIVEIGQYLQSMGYGKKQAIVNINYGAAAPLACDTYTGLTKWCGHEVVLVQAAPLLFPEKRNTIVSYPLTPMSDLDEAEQEELQLARENAPTSSLVF